MALIILAAAAPNRVSVSEHFQFSMARWHNTVGCQTINKQSPNCDQTNYCNQLCHLNAREGEGSMARANQIIASPGSKHHFDLLRHMVLAICGMFCCINNASALECQSMMGGGGSHWAWRLIDGRQCWYRGDPGMDKSLLHWPSLDSRTVTIEATADKLHEEQVPAPPQVQPIQPELMRMLPILPLNPSFEDRWRLR